MSDFIVSARKYRPATFRSVVGQKHITSTLQNAIERGQLAHAYLFCGPRGVGKTTYDHFYHYKLKDAKAAVEIRATDCFGKVYTQNVFTTAAETDYPMVDNYPAVAE